MLVALIPPLPRAAEACTIGVSHKQRVIYKVTKWVLQSTAEKLSLYKQGVDFLRSSRAWLRKIQVLLSLAPIK